jgi:hypothetical protein
MAPGPQLKLLLGPVTCQGCGEFVRYVEPDQGLPGWFIFDLNLFGGPVPFILLRHFCPAGPRPIEPQIIHWDGPPTLLGQFVGPA